jgi:hypothetical protein
MLYTRYRYNGTSTMRLVFRLIVLIAMTLAVSQSATAWGPFTHAYIALQVMPDAPPQALFGAMAADMNSFTASKETNSACKYFTHHQASLVAPSPFQSGMLTHNGDWGADSYAHGYFKSTSTKSYPYRIFEQLSSETGISINDAEDIIETVMDYVICRDRGPRFTARIAEAATAAGADDEQAMVDAFAEPLRERAKELTSVRAQWALRTMFRCDKILLRYLASCMSLPDTFLHDAGVYVLGHKFHMEPSKTEACVNRAFELCADWQPNLDAISEAIAAEMDDPAHIAVAGVKKNE